MRTLLLTLFGIFCIGTLFISSQLFTDSLILPKWYFMFACTIVIGVGSVLIRCRKVDLISIDFLSVSLIIFILYLILRSAFSPLINLFSVFPLISFLILYTFFKKAQKSYIDYFIIIFVVTGLSEAFYGLLQYSSNIEHSRLYINGSFDNPAGFASSIAIVFPFCFKFFHRSRKEQIFGISSIVIFYACIILSGSRAGLLSLTITTAIWLYTIYFKSYFKKYKILKYIASVSFCTFLLLLFVIKKDSALGRTFIWRITSKMILDVPIFGGGYGSFEKRYMLYQAEYFKENISSSYVMISDNILHPFNEYLLLFSEYGILGIIFLLLICILLGKYAKKLSNVYLLSTISISIFACFSYPLYYPFTLIVLAYNLSRLSLNFHSFKFLLNKRVISIFSVAISISFILFGYYLIKDILFEQNWRKLNKTTVFKTNHEIKQRYDGLYNNWTGNPSFLYNYGAELNSIEEYKLSNIILTEYTKHVNDYNSQLLIADNYFKLKQWSNAELHSKNALNMCPNRFVPLENLINIYDSLKNREQAKTIAEIICNKPIKIPSQTIEKIKTKAQKRFNQPTDIVDSSK